MEQNYPLTKKWCDMSCQFARFPEQEGVDGSGSCRTFIAIFCQKQNKLVHKNSLCSFNEKDSEAVL